MAKFHITIKNNETGEIMHDSDTKAIIGAYDSQDKTECIAVTECDSITFAATVNGVKSILEKILDDHPEVNAMAELISKYFTEKVTKE